MHDELIPALILGSVLNAQSLAVPQIDSNVNSNYRGSSIPKSQHKIDLDKKRNRKRNKLARQSRKKNR